MAIIASKTPIVPKSIVVYGKYIKYRITKSINKIPTTGRDDAGNIRNRNRKMEAAGQRPQIKAIKASRGGLIISRLRVALLTASFSIISRSFCFSSSVIPLLCNALPSSAYISNGNTG
jgi:hypothetical protein